MSLVANPLVVPLFGSLVVVLGLAARLLEPRQRRRWRGAVPRSPASRSGPGSPSSSALGQAVVGRARRARVPSALELVLLYALLAAAVVPARRGRAVRSRLAAVLALAIDAGVVDARALGARRAARDVPRRRAGRRGRRRSCRTAASWSSTRADSPAATSTPGPRSSSRTSRTRKIAAHRRAGHDARAPGSLRRSGVPACGATGRASSGGAGGPGAAPSGSVWSAALGETGVPRGRAASRRPAARVRGPVDVLHPPAGWTVPALNETSLTLRLRRGAVGVLLTGDVEARAESSLLGVRDGLSARRAQGPASRQPDVERGGLPGRGRAARWRSSRSAPTTGIISRRRRSRRATARAGICVLRTDRCGAVTVVTDGRRLDVTTFRPGCACAPAVLRGLTQELQRFG